MTNSQSATRNVEVGFHFPTPPHPFYHLKLAFTLEGEAAAQVKEVKVNGRRVRDFATLHGFSPVNEARLPPGGWSELVVRWDWKAGEEAAIEAAGDLEGGKGPFRLRANGRAPATGGYWDPAWKYYASLVCTENAGISRQGEPVHASLAFYNDRLQDPERELRIVAVDPSSGAHREVPCQVYEVNRWTREGLKRDPKDEFFELRYQPTVTFQVAFLADVPAWSTRIYLAFYGNPRAPQPRYAGGLKVEGEGLGIAVENEFYRTLLAKTSGSIDEIHMKMGANQVFAHHLETNGALHWNPGIYAPPRMWLHASDWNPPARYELTAGPVFVSTRRSGPLQFYEEETEVSITYRFYDRLPWIHMCSSYQVKKPVAVQALRNGEVVLNRELVEEFAWRKPGGGAGTMVITDGPRHPKHAKVLPPDTPWACLFSRRRRCGLGLVTARLANFRQDGGLPKTFGYYSYLQWGPWVYYCRPLVYTFLSNNNGRLVHVPAGNHYYEEMAFVPLRIDPQREDFRELENLYQRLANPLDVQVVEDTDPRAPEGWVPPVLVAGFEEMED